MLYKSSTSSVWRLIMIEALIFSVLTGLGSNALASGCDSNFFQSGKIVSQKIVQDFGQPDITNSKILIDRMSTAHKNALHSWDELPTINSSNAIKLVTTMYSGLDTHCGWTKYGSNLSITHLEITSNEGTFYYPDIYKNINPEYSALDELIEIRAP